MNQKKQLIAILAFLIAVGLIGYTFVSAPTVPEDVLQEQVRAQGEVIYLENCAECHGREGKAVACYTEDGERVACVGRLLQTPDLLCGAPSLRLQAMSWNGSLESYLIAVTTVGRSENGMPAYGLTYGGALTEARIELVSTYIAGWQTENLCQG